MSKRLSTPSNNRSRAKLAFRFCSPAFSGAYMLIKLEVWERFLHASFWWMHLMVAVWAVFALMVYVLEPLLLHEKFRKFAFRRKNRAFALATSFHGFALLASAIAIGAGVLGAHGSLP